MELFDTLLIHPLINILLAIYQAVHAIGMPYALGFSIILLTVVVRLILYPFTASQLKAAKKMQELSPHLSKLKERHKNDPKRLQQESMKLYQEHGVNPVAGCLPILIQLPVIWGLYAVLSQIVGLKPEEIVARVNSIAYIDAFHIQTAWDTSFFGLPLGQNPSQLLGTVGPLIFLVPIVTGVLQFVQSKMMFAPVKKDEKAKKKSEPDFQSALQTQSMYIFPVMIGFFSYTFPLGLSLYWNTFTIFGIIQQYKIQGLGGLAPLLEKAGLRIPEIKK